MQSGKVAAGVTPPPRNVHKLMQVLSAMLEGKSAKRSPQPAPGTGTIKTAIAGDRFSLLEDFLARQSQKCSQQSQPVPPPKPATPPSLHPMPLVHGGDCDSKRRLQSRAEESSSGSSGSEDSPHRRTEWASSSGSESDSDELAELSEENSHLDRRLQELIEMAKKQQLFQSHVSSVLREFRQTKGQAKGRYRNAIVHAHKCLLVAAHRLSAIRQEMQRVSTGAEECVSECLQSNMAIRNVTLFVRADWSGPQKGDPEWHLVCLVQHRAQVFESSVLSVRPQSECLQFEINRIFSGLSPDFEVDIKFFWMSQAWPQSADGSKGRKAKWISSLWKMAVRGFKSRFRNRNSNRLLALESAGVSAGSDALHSAQVMSSAFRLLGQVRVRLANWRQEKCALDLFDSSLMFGRQVTLSLELFHEYDTITCLEFGPQQAEMPSASVFTVQVNSEKQTIERKHRKRQLKYFALQEIRLEEASLHLTLWAKGDKPGGAQKVTFNLANCLNPIADLDAKMLAGNKLCFVFKLFTHRSVKFVNRSGLDKAKSGRVLREFKVLLLLNPPRPNSLADLSNKVLQRSSELRKWSASHEGHTDQDYLLDVPSRRTLALYLQHHF